MTAIEPTSGVNLAEFAGSRFSNQSFTKGRSSQALVVNDYRDAVARQADIQFDAVSAVIQSSGEGSERIFGGESRGATVADYQRRGFRNTV
jgi:hypothetical protein